MNVEHIDDDYLEKRKKDTKGQLFKCNYGADFVFAGTNPSFYPATVYEPQNNVDEPDFYSLMLFTKALDDKNNPDYRCNLEAIFDVDNYLKRMALEVLVGHWDNPAFNKNNAYLYFNPQINKFELLSYDTDNTFGIDWLGYDWATRNIYSWSHPTSKRPIFNNLMEVQEYKKRYGYYIDYYAKNIFNSAKLNPLIETIFERIKAYRIDDNYASLDYGYTYDDFEKSYQSASGAHVKYGIKEFVNIRSSTAIQQIQNIAFSPVIENVKNFWTASECTILFDAWHPQPINVKVFYKLSNGAWQNTILNDNGVFPDIKANDSRYTFQLTYTGKEKLEFYTEVTVNNTVKSRWPVCDYYNIDLGYDAIPLLKINEIMASNSTIADEKGEFDDWIEIYNADQNTIYLGDYYLSDARSKRDKWRLPSVDLGPGEFILIWADEQQEQGDHHTNFKLDKDGEFIGIFDSELNSFAPIDTFRYSMINTDKTKGRYPNGYGDFIDLTSPTPGTSNVLSSTSVEEQSVNIYPNPFDDYLTLCTFQSLDKVYDINIVDTHGNRIKPIYSYVDDCIIFDMESYNKGLYILECRMYDQIIRSKVVKVE